jgi:hypothetical protein
MCETRLDWARAARLAWQLGLAGAAIGCGAKTGLEIARPDATIARDAGIVRDSAMPMVPRDAGQDAGQVDSGGDIPIYGGPSAPDVPEDPPVAPPPSPPQVRRRRNR